MIPRGAAWVSTMLSMRSRLNTKKIRRILLDAALNTETFKTSLHYVTFRIIISIVSTLIMMLSCYVMPGTNYLFKFFLEIIACLYVQKCFVILHPILVPLQNKTSFITDVLIINSKKPMFHFTCEVCLYCFLYIICFFVNISSHKIQYMVLQQICICIYNNLSVIYDKYSYIQEYSKFEIVEYPKQQMNTNTEKQTRQETVDIQTKTQKDKLTVVLNYF